MTEAEKERWQLIGVIASAVGTAIAGYFAAKKENYEQQDIGAREWFHFNGNQCPCQKFRQKEK